MRPIIEKESYPGWRFYGKRYLRSNEFVMLCTAVGLYHSHESELEDYERSGVLFPVARMIMPDEYAKAIWLFFNSGVEKVNVDESLEAFHHLDWAIRYPDTLIPGENKSDLDMHHTIDSQWGKVEGLFLPKNQEYIPWDQYNFPVEYEGQTYQQPTATQFYHYWQIYEFFQTRKMAQGMYIDPAPISLADMLGHIKAMNPYLDAMSYFQHSYREKITSLLLVNEPDEENLWSLMEEQQKELETSAKAFAQETLEKYTLSPESLYEGLRGLVTLHHAFELLERTRLADTLKSDIWRLIELVHYAFNYPTEDIAHNVGGVPGIRGDYVELLFPNRRKRTKEKAARILTNLADEHNKFAPGWTMANTDVEGLLGFLDKTELVLLEYIIEQTNQAFFARHSWQAAETFLQLKSVASFPESMMKVILLNSGDRAAIQRFNQEYRGMDSLSKIYFEVLSPGIWAEYQTTNHRSSRDATEFMGNLRFLISTVIQAQNEDVYLGASLSLATCIRNFTSHLVLEKPDLLSGQYVRCIRAIVTTIYIIWHSANQRKWII
jgi:hypothetical protein